MEQEHEYRESLGSLQDLQQRIFELTSKYSTGSPAMSVPQSSGWQNLNTAPAPPPAAARDPFAEQLSDILRRLHALERSRPQLRTDIHEFSQRAFNANLAPSGHATSGRGSMFPRNTQANIDEIFNRLFTIERRLKHTERQLDVHEDRLDSLGPDRYTPASSTAGTDYYLYPGLPSSQAPAPMCELYSDSKPLARTSTANLSQFALNNGSGDCQRHFGPCACRSVWNPPTVSAPSVTDDSTLRHNIHGLLEHSSVLSGKVDQLDQENERLTQLIGSMYVNTPRLRRPSFLHQSAGSELPGDRTPRADDTNSEHAVSLGGVDFRDREIARLDEQLKLAHDGMKMFEENAAEKDRELKRLREQIGDSQTQLARLTDQHRQEIFRRDAEFDAVRQELVSWQRATARWQDSWHQMDEDLRQWRARADADRHHFHMSEENDKAERRKMIADHEDKVNTLSDFCTEKDVVIHQQQKSISWAGKIMMERDQELDVMKRNLRAAEGDLQHAIRKADRFERLLLERDAEIEQLKRQHDIHQDAPLQRGTGVNEPSLNDRFQADFKKMMSSSDADAKKVLIESPAGSPTPHLRGNGEALCLENVHKIDGSCLFGSVSPRAVRRGSDGEASMSAQVSEASGSSERRRRRRMGNRNRRPYPRHNPEMGRQASFQRGTPDAQIRDHHAGRQWPEWKARLPARNMRPSSEEMSFWPPLPAPVTARRMASEADLTNAYPGDRPHRQSVGKPRSMEDLPQQRRLQAYVEDEESGREGR